MGNPTKGEIKMSVEKLKSIMNLMPNIFYDETMLRTALGRSYSDDKRAGNVLFAVIESGVIDNALHMKMVNKTTYERYVDTIYDDYGVEKKFAKKYIGYWLDALNIPYDDFTLETNKEPRVEIKYEAQPQKDDDNDDEIDKVTNTFNTLSPSEKNAAVFLFHEFNGMDEGVIVASKVADKYNVTRSLIVSALKKLEIAGLVASNSLGMKGTYIKIKNKVLLEVMAKYAKNMSFMNSWRGR